MTSGMSSNNIKLNFCLSNIASLNFKENYKNLFLIKNDEFLAVETMDRKI